jgi:hypothetical protein
MVPVDPSMKSPAGQVGFEYPTAQVPTTVIDTHEVCVADDRLLLDFGLGQARKAWHEPVL